jgi:type II secretory pathway pseudopilin PulG
MKFERNLVNAATSRNARARAGFTLAEVLAALVFMAIVIPVALEGMHVASRAGSVAARKGEAARVAQRILNETIVTTNWTGGGTQSGTEYDGTRQFRWTVRNDAWGVDPTLTPLRLLSAEVVFAVQGQDYSVRMSTIVDSALSTNLSQ